jgi:restriction system protein
MPVPDFQTIMRPLLVALDDGQDHAIAAVRAHLAAEFKLTEAEMQEQLPSGRAKTEVVPFAVELRGGDPVISERLRA